MIGRALKRALQIAVGSFRLNRDFRELDTLSDSDLRDMGLTRTQVSSFTNRYIGA